MCYNYKTSFYAFLIAFVSGLILLTDNDYENRTIGIVCILVSLIQLNEYFLWKNQSCDKMNHILSLLIICILYFQAIIIGSFNKSYMNLVISIIFTFVFIYLLYNGCKNNVCTIKGIKSKRLEWGIFKENSLEPDSSYLTSLFGFCYILLLYSYIDKVSYPVRKMTPILTFIIAFIYSLGRSASASASQIEGNQTTSFLVFPRTNNLEIFGTMWCFLSVILGPIALLKI